MAAALELRSILRPGPLRYSNMAHRRPACSQRNAEQQLNAMAKQIAAGRHIPFAQAYLQALTENPQLYTAYLGQHSRQTGAR